MYCTLKKCLCRKEAVRALSTGEVSTALRPFYFSVHPDLFGQFPTQRTVNENSLKQLSSLIENLQQRRPVRPTTLPFYLRSKDEKEVKAGKFTLVRIQLADHDVRQTILCILKTCNLSTTFVDKIEEKKPPSSRLNSHLWQRYKSDVGGIDFSELEDDPIFASIIMRRKINLEPDTFKAYLEKHANEALVKLEACRPIREEVSKLEMELCSDLGLKKIVWDCGWNIAHYRGCLLAFLALSRHHPEPMQVLRDRTLVFANDTGINLEGNVMLNSGEVRHNWLDIQSPGKMSNCKKSDCASAKCWAIHDTQYCDPENYFCIPCQHPELECECLVDMHIRAIVKTTSAFLWSKLVKNVNKQDVVLMRLPAFEKAVSQVLLGIKIGRRKFMPKVMVDQYEQQLRQLTTTLSDYRSRRKYPSDWPENLSAYELVVETEAGPLMLSPTGQFIVPSSCPSFLLISFITENLVAATERLNHYNRVKHVERELHQKVAVELELAALDKDDSITPDLMIQCCDRLLQNKSVLVPFLTGVRLWVTHYYSVMSDGVLCIPWDWKI